MAAKKEVSPFTFFLPMLYVTNTDKSINHDEFLKRLGQFEKPPTGAASKKTALVIINTHGSMAIDMSSLTSDDFYKVHSVDPDTLLSDEFDVDAYGELLEVDKDLLKHGVRAKIPDGMEVEDVRVTNMACIKRSNFHTELIKQNLDLLAQLRGERAGKPGTRIHLNEHELLAYAELAAVSVQKSHKMRFPKDEISLFVKPGSSTSRLNPVFESSFGTEISDKERPLQSITIISSDGEMFDLFLQGSIVEVGQIKRGYFRVTTSEILKALSDRGFKKVVIFNGSCANKLTSKFKECFDLDETQELPMKPKPSSKVVLPPKASVRSFVQLGAEEHTFAPRPGLVKLNTAPPAGSRCLWSPKLEKFTDIFGRRFSFNPESKEVFFLGSMERESATEPKVGKWKLEKVDEGGEHYALIGTFPPLYRYDAEDDNHYYTTDLSNQQTKVSLEYAREKYSEIQARLAKLHEDKGEAALEKFKGPPREPRPGGGTRRKRKTRKTRKRKTRKR
jgi:hypothetical protein